MEEEEEEEKLEDKEEMKKDTLYEMGKTEKEEGDKEADKAKVEDKKDGEGEE